MPRRRPDGWWYPWIFVAGMLVVIAVNAVMITYAIGTFPGLDTDDAYRKGLAYNETLRAARAQDARGWRADVAFTGSAPPDAPADGPSDAPPSRAGELRVQLLDRDGWPVGGLTVSAVLKRPTHRGADVALELDEHSAGSYVGAVALPQPGQWDAWVHARGPAGAYQTTQRLVVP